MEPPAPASTKGQRFAWCLYDFANSAFPTVIVTAVYVIYFKDVVVADSEGGTSDRLWGTANSLAAAIVFLTAPILGAIADLSGKKRTFLIVYASICVLATAMLATTGPGTVALAVTAFIIAAVGFEGSCVFYNAFLPELVPPTKMEKLSGAGWALGYIGGLGCLMICLPLAMEDIGGRPDLVPLVVAGWFALFALPAIFKLKDLPRSAPPAGSLVKAGFGRFVGTIKEIRKHRNLVRFLVAYFFYNNAVVTIIVFAVAFSKDSLSFTMTENIMLITAMNVIAAPGAFAFGWVAQKIGAKRTIVITLFMWLLVVAGAEAAAWPGLFSSHGAKMCFWGVAGFASLCIGAVQATSRTFVGQMAPRGRSGEFFGFMAFSGKGSAILGPLVFGLTSDIFDSQRAAVLSIGVFFAVGLLLMLRVRQPELTEGDK